MKFDFRRVLLVGASCSVVAPVHGQSAATNEDAVQEVTVTASKQSAQTVLEVPGAIQAIGSELLQEQGAVGFMDIAGEIPGLSIEDLGPGDRKYIIRGISSTGDSTTGVYYDEAVISGSNANDGGGYEADVRLYDMDRIEVLRGPQGTLYGAGSMSGTIRFVTKKPDLESVSGYVTGEYSDTSHGSGNYNVNGMVNLPLVTDVLGVRAVGWRVSDSGYIDQIRLGEIAPGQGVGLAEGVNNDIVSGGRVALRYQPLQALVFDATVTAQTETSGGSSMYTPAGVTSWSSTGALDIPAVQGCDLCNTDVARSPSTDTLHIFSLTGAYTMSNGVITATTNQFNRDVLYTGDSTAIDAYYGFPVPALSYEPRERRLNSSEIRYASNFDFPVNFVAGAFRQHETSDLTVQVLRINAFGDPAGPFSTSNSQDALLYSNGTTEFGRTDHRDTNQDAGFGEVTWKVTSRFTALAGIRYFRETLTGVQVQTHPFGGFTDGAVPTPIYDVPETYSKLTSKYTLSYEFNSAALLYATAAQGFRGGGLNAQSEPFEAIPPSFGPDSLWNYEMGLKGRLLGGMLDYQTDIYEIFWSNIQVNEVSPGGFNYTGNAGDARVKGWEYELTSRPLRGLTLSLTGTYTEAYLVKGATPEQYAASPTLGLTGNTIPEVPKFSGSLGAAYSHIIGPDLRATAGADLSYRGREDTYFASNPENWPLHSYILTNLRAGLDGGPWSVTAFVRNVTNKRAEVSGVNTPSDPYSLITVRPRTVGISVTRKF
jgi:iron complex outermembrane recepter protein